MFVCVCAVLCVHSSMQNKLVTKENHLTHSLISQISDLYCILSSKEPEWLVNKLHPQVLLYTTLHGLLSRMNWDRTYNLCIFTRIKQAWMLKVHLEDKVQIPLLLWRSCNITIPLISQPRGMVVSHSIPHVPPFCMQQSCFPCDGLEKPTPINAPAVF